jgi:NAD(P)-dependent dehydrogenase (short-subunit alcohol dehydrogenase family)
MLPNFSLSGRRALVTGASSGLGRHFATLLAAAGAEVFIAARRVDRLQALVEQIASSGGRAHAVALDVVDAASVARCFDGIGAQGGCADLIVNNAGTTNSSPALKLGEAEWDAVVDTNLKGAWLVCQEAGKRLVAAQRGGCIVNIT